jgi:hypothetical protein
VRRWLGVLVAAAVIAAGVVALRAEVMTVHLAPPSGSQTEFVVVAHTKEDARHLPEMTRSLVSLCRLLVNGDVVENSFDARADGVFAFSVTPGLDEFDVREMRGCLQDMRVQHLLLDVRQVRTTQT